jgi:UDP:flavonoid glycosyltransferase YjiC (YdhE family)
VRVLIGLFSAPTGTWGGLTRGLAVADAARRRGHEVHVAASGPVTTPLRTRGEQVHDLPAATVLGLPEPVSRRIQQGSQRTRLPVREGRGVGNIWFVLAFSGFASRSYLRRATTAYLGLVDQVRPDVLFTDLDPITLMTSRITGLPVAATYASVMHEGHGSIPWQLLRRATGGVLRDHGHTLIDPDELYFAPQVRKIIPSIPELDDTDPARPDVCYVGHLTADLATRETGPARPPSDGTRYVFVYVGTGSVPLGRLREVLPAVFPAASPVTFLVGAHSLTRSERIGAVEFHPYVSARDVLASSDWTICHGGQNTIIESLRHDVPLLIFPGPIFERRFNAAKVAAAGAGHFAELSEFRPDRLRTILADRDRHVAGAVRLGASLRALGGPDAVVDTLEELAARPDPSPRAAV